jgi:hypothetical protein
MPKAKKATKTKKAAKAAKSSPKAAKAAKGGAPKAKKPAKKAGAKKSNVRRPPPAPVREVEPINVAAPIAQAPAEPLEAAMLVPEPEVTETDVGWDTGVEG